MSATTFALNTSDSLNNLKQNKNQKEEKLMKYMPFHILNEFKYSNKPISMINHKNEMQIEKSIAKMFNTTQNKISIEKINSVSEGIIDAFWYEKEAILFFKNYVDINFITHFFRPHQMKQLDLFLTVNDGLSVIAISFNR